jgi:MYXO-CTERM domain-containing protein
MRLNSIIPLSSITLAALAATSTLLAPANAHACGGTFCDGQAMPVEQTGENILFVRDGDTVEAHIQIQYNPDTDASQFAWVVPVTEVPTFAVGSEALFQNLLNGSVPNYGRDYDLVCDDDSNGTAQSTAGGTSTGGEDGGGETGDTGGDPTVVYEETVGAYDITVLQGGTVELLMQWLADNGYTQDPAAEPIFENYLEEEYLFVALKLTTNAEVSEIHPIVLTQESGEACVPLKLTQIAAQENMEVRTFFLGDARTVPTNYKHVLINPLRVDWANFADNYKEVITMAVDHASAEGRAFVTEFAGSSESIQPVYIHDDASGESFASHDAPTTITTGLLQSWNLMYCDEWEGCNFQSELLKPILDQFMPVPDGMDPWTYYDCPECFAAMADLTVWDGAAFGQMLEDRLFAPARNANELLANHPYLTRLYTTISPYEMTEDPVFEQNPDLDEVPQQRMALGEVDCEGATIWTLPGGEQIYSPDLSFPEFPEEDPWAMTVEQGTTIGANQVLADMCPEIISAISVNNQKYNFQGSFGQCGGETDSGETDGGGQNDSGGAGSCACTADSDAGGWGGLFLAALFGVGLRRRRD